MSRTAVTAPRRHRGRSGAHELQEPPSEVTTAVRGRVGSVTANWEAASGRPGGSRSRRGSSPTANLDRGCRLAGARLPCGGRRRACRSAGPYVLNADAPAPHRIRSLPVPRARPRVVEDHRAHANGAVRSARRKQAPPCFAPGANRLLSRARHQCTIYGAWPT